VNTASRMESTGIAGKIQVTEAVVDLLRGMFTFEPRGPVAVKGKGLMSTYFLTGRIEPRPPSRQLNHDITGIPDTIYFDKSHAKLTLFDKLRDLQLALAADEEMNLNPDVGCLRSKSLVIRRTLSDDDFDTDSQSI
jgi:Adenylate and Guanylate cyclase catalytic domain